MTAGEGLTMEAAYRTITASKAGAEYAMALVMLAIACEEDDAARDILDRARLVPDAFPQDEAVDRLQHRRDRTDDAVGKARRRVANAHEDLLALTGAKGRI